jgi:hypothetical protein
MALLSLGRELLTSDTPRAGRAFENAAKKRSSQGKETIMNEQATSTEAREALVERILDGPGKAPEEQRRAAFDNARLAGPLAILIDKVAKHAHRVTDEDVAAVRAAGLTEDQIYELVICAAVGQAQRQLEAALSALSTATSGR